MSFDQVRSSAARCRICQFYVDVVLVVLRGCLPRVFKGTRSEAEKKSILDRMDFFHPGRHNAGINLRFNILEKKIRLDIFREDRYFNFEGQSFRPGFRIGQRTNSEGSFVKARQWLHECLTSHNCLKTSPTSIQLPKRLLDVRGSSEDPIRLVETQGDEYPYACLSHRWGSPEQKRLISTTRTIQDHMTKIKWEDLPATFQDAVTICRRMAVCYCWIDSLCILQNEDGLTDDEVEATRLDFAQQNSEMARVYYNSHFTISADISTHMNSGIFSKSSIVDQRIEVIDDDGDSAAVYVRHPVHHFSGILDLETRGWTFQEFSLPRRMLHFGPVDIEWRCTNRHTCECGGMDSGPGFQKKWHHHHYLAEVARPVPRDLPQAVKWWEAVVHFYMKRELTNPNDKLPALSGLAQLRKEARGGIYLAGLWQDSIIHDLCWYTNLNLDNTRRIGTFDRFGRRPVDYRAPSWSWASLDTHSGCDFWRRPDTPGISNPIYPWTEPRKVCTIFESFCQPKTADATGEVQSGFLDVGVVLIPATVCLDHQPGLAWNVTDVATDLKLDVFRPDCALANDGLSVGERVYCAPIAEAVVETRTQCACLVLRKSHTNLYQRIGFCILAKGDDESQETLQFRVGANGLPHYVPKPPSLNRQDYTFLDAVKSRIIII